MQYRAWPLVQSLPVGMGRQVPDDSTSSDFVQIPADSTDVWEVDPRLLKFEQKIASGSFGDLYVLRSILKNQFLFIYIIYNILVCSPPDTTGHTVVKM
jgi:hypothetical protein